MALTLSSTFFQQATSGVTTCTSGSVAVAVDDIVVIRYCAEDNAPAGTLSISNTGAALTFTNIATTNTGNNTKAAAWWAKVATAGNITVTITQSGSGVRATASLDVYTGAHATTPVPAGNIFSGVNGTDISQSITPTSTGSMLGSVFGDWNATNTFAAIASCTIESTTHVAAAYTATFIKPTTQPLGTGGFTIGETDTGGTIAWIAFEVQAAASGPVTHVTTGALIGGGSTVIGASSFISNGAKIPIATIKKRKKRPAYDDLTGFYNTNPFAEFAAELSPLWYTVGGATTHVTTGALIGQGSVITGSAARFRSFSASGVLIGQGSVIAGTAAHLALHTTSGALLGQGSVIAGVAARFRSHSTSGALTGQGSEIVGSASRSAGAVTHVTTGVLTGQGSTIVGVSARFRQFATSGALIGQGSELSGTAARLRSFSTSGVLIGQGSVIAGTAAHIAVHGTTGSLIGQGSELAGVAARFRSHPTSGALIGQGSAIDGAAVRIPPGGITHDTSGVLVGSGSELSGLATNGQIVVASGGGIAFHRKTYSPKDIRESVEKQRNPRQKLTLKKPKEQEKQQDTKQAEKEQQASVIRYKNSRSIGRYEQHYEQMLMHYLERVELQLEEDAIIRIIAELL